jgi:hypothetical protein
VVTSLATCRHRLASRRAQICVLSAAGAVALGLPGVATAGPGGGNDPIQHESTAEEATHPSDASETNGTTSADGASSDPQATATPAGTPNESTDDDATSPAEAADAQTGNQQATVPADDQEDAQEEPSGESNDDVEQPAVTAPASGTPPTTTTEQTTTVDQGVSATADAEQHGQGNDDGNTYGHGNGNGNVNADIRVDEPGSTEGVSQLNEASATAEATASTTVESGGDAAATQAADASAAATQDRIGNVHVSVRVESPGDDGDVTQVNQATAASTAVVDVETADDGTVDQVGTSQADATATQDHVSNTAVSVRVLSPGADGGVIQTNQADARASGDDASAAAVQDGVRNTYVGIRVESPGERGAIAQSTGGNASTTPGGTVSVATGGLDTVVFADISAPELTVPGATTVWEWIWDWQADESALDDASRLVDGDSWSWIWGNLPGGKLVERDVTDITPGTWRWNWAWSRDVEGWAWDWQQSSALACATCAWIWSWNWDWSGEPDAQPDAAAAGPAVSSRPPDQATTATASANADAGATVSQLVEQDDEDAERFAGQIATVSQVVDASAVAVQVLDPAGDGLGTKGSGRRSLEVVAGAAAISTIDQVILQHAGVVGSGAAAQWAGQQAEVAQDVAADAAGLQQLGTTGPVDGGAHAQSMAVAGNEQSAAQVASLGDGQLSQWSGQLAVVTQVVGASVRTAQKVRNARNVHATSSGVATDLSLGTQTIRQNAARRAGLGTQTGAQSLEIAQGAAGDATTSQTVDSWEDAPVARSESTASNRSLVLQTGLQAMNGAAEVDIQDLLQDAIVVQLAYASSSSSGGIGGSARTVNCATTQQDAGQGIGVFVSVGASDLMAFCAPPRQPAGHSGTDGAHDGAPATTVEQAASVVVTSTLAEEDVLRHGNTASPARRHTRPGPGEKVSTERAPDIRVMSDGAAIRSQVSSPASPQARLDTRPEGSAGTKGVAGESPLPSTDGPPNWVSAFAQGAAGSGGTGITAILFAFVLAPSLLRRVREEAVVRRPASAFAPLDVPV